MGWNQFLQPLDMSVNKYFKENLYMQWMADGGHGFMPTGKRSTSMEHDTNQLTMWS
jgi:hypothetical protein